MANKLLYDRLKSHQKHLLPCKNFLGFISWLIKINKTIKNERIDVVILNGGRALFAAPFIIARKKVAVRHTLNACISLWKRWYYLPLLQMSYCFFDIVIHVSKSSQAEQLFRKDKSVVIYNGVQVEHRYFKPKTNFDKIEFLFVGRLSKSKGVDVLLEAFSLLPMENIHLSLIGDGEFFSRTAYTNVTFEGFKSGPDLEKYYLAADYFISLPDFENCPFSTIDALSHGLPVITTNVGGLKEIIVDGHNGYFVHKTSADVANLIQRIVRSGDNNALRRNAYETAKQKFNVEKTINRYTDLLDNL